MALLYKYNLAVCAICKNEEKYLEEWLECHLLFGVEHFYMYDNESTDGTLSILQRYSDLGLVTWETIREYPCQFKSYNDCIQKRKEEAKWCAFIDCDEFLYTPWVSHMGYLLNKEYDNYSGVAVRWYLFGSSGRTHYEPELVIRRFTNRGAINKHVKSIMKLSETISVDLDPHTFLATGRIVNERKEELPRHYAVSEGGSGEQLRINHYHTKSKEEALERWKLPDPGSMINRLERFDETFREHDLNEVSDYGLSSLGLQVEQAIRFRQGPIC